MGMLVAVAISGGALFAAIGANHPSPSAVGITTTTSLGTPFGRNFLAADDLVTDRQWQEREAAFRQFVARGPVQLDRLLAAQGLEYIDKAISDPTLKGQLAEGVRGQKIEMVAIGFYDDCAEDGDVVRVQAAGVDVTVSLYHRVQYVELPVLKGQQVQVTVSGIRDGTGGITLGMVTPAGDVHMPRLQPGQRISFVAR